jgi:2-methylcitrate dehydratase PrpD
MRIADQAARFVAAVNPTALPERCIDAARTGIADCIGVMIAGSGEPAPQIVAKLVPTSTSNEGAPEIPSGRNLSAPDAALVNGVAAHVLDYDDVALAGHPSTVLTPAILAEAWTHDASGADMAAAYVAGYELWALLLSLEPGALHERGFHPTALYGALAAAAACAKLHGLDEERTTNAIALSASMAAGLVANFGTMTKSFHAGRAAQSGVLAARLAKEGFTASPDVIEHRTGFLRAISPSGAPRIDVGDARLGADWRMPEVGVNVKRYPTCYSTHRAIDAMLDLAREHDLKPDAVKEIRVRTGTVQMLMLRNAHPKTGLEAKFSMQFAMAAALVARRVGLSELTDEFVARPEVVANLGKVTCTTTEETVPELAMAPDDRVSVVLADGRVIEHEPVAFAKGSWKRPLTREELREKFLDCATRRFDQDHAEALFDQLWNITDLASVRDLRLTEAGTPGKAKNGAKSAKTGAKSAARRRKLS